MAVDVSTSFKQVCDRLGLWAGGGTYRTLERHMARLKLETTQLERQAALKNGAVAAPGRTTTSPRPSATACRSRRSADAWDTTRAAASTASSSNTSPASASTRAHFTGQSWAKGEVVRRSTPSARSRRSLCRELDIHEYWPSSEKTHRRRAEGSVLRGVRARHDGEASLSHSSSTTSTATTRTTGSRTCAFCARTAML